MQKTLPKSWKMVRLGEITKCLDEQRVPVNEVERANRKGNIPYYGANGQVGWIDDYLFDQKLLLVAEDGGYWGSNEPSSYIINGKSWVNNHSHILAKNGKALLEFLNHYLFLANLKKYISGTTRGKLNKQHFLKIEIPLPPLPTQHKIVEILEEADNLRKLRQQADKKMKDLIPSLFVEMFGDTATNPKGWEVTELSNVANFKRGPFGGSLKKEIFVDRGYKVYEQKNAIYNNFELGHYFITEEKYYEMIGFSIAPNDLIISCSGTMGKVALVPKNMQPGVINQALLKITPNFKTTTSLFLKLLIESETIQRKYFKNTAGSAIQNVASLGTLKKIKTPLPPLPLQQEFAERVEEIEAEKTHQAESKNKLNELFNSLMQRAFKGKLVA